MMAKFNLQDLLNERSKETKREEIKQIYLNLNEIIPSENNFYNTKDIDSLKQSIALVGVLQPLLVKKQEDGTYLLLAGHRRRLACLALVEEGMEEFKKIPCIIKDTNITEEMIEQQDDVNMILDQLILIFANSFRDKSEWEKMEETLQTERLIVELKKKAGLKGRVRSILAEYTGIKETQIARYKAIHNNLNEELKEVFKDNGINISIAYELSGLGEEYQKKAYSCYVNSEKLSLSDVRELKQREDEQRQIEGQMTFEEIEQEQQLQIIDYRNEVLTEIPMKEDSGEQISSVLKSTEKDFNTKSPNVQKRIEITREFPDEAELYQEEEIIPDETEEEKSNRLLDEIERVLKKYTKYCDGYKKSGLEEDVIREKEIIKNALELYYRKVAGI